MMRPGVFASSLCLLMFLTGCAMSQRGHVDRQTAAQANAKLGLDLLGKGQYQQATERLKRALSYDNANVLANWGMALVYQHLEQPDEAGDYYGRIVNRHARPAILNSYAVFLCQQGDTGKAIDYFSRAANDRRNAAPAVALANAGLCLEKAGEYTAAANSYRKALSVDKTQPAALTHMARIQYQRGKYLSARGFIERADAATDLNPKFLLLAARIEMKLGNRDAAGRYLLRHNQRKPASALTFEQLLGPSS